MLSSKTSSLCTLASTFGPNSKKTLLTAQNITIDCNGYEINYSYSGTVGYGVYSDQFNTTVRNCVIKEGESGTGSKHGINFNGAENSTIDNNSITTLHTDSIPIRMKSNYNKINNNVVLTNGYGIYITIKDNSEISNNILTSSGGSSWWEE